MNILITGHSGFIGSHTASYFVQRGHTVYGVSRSLNPDCNFRQYDLDVTDYDSLSRLTNENAIDIIVHFAGKPIVSDCDRDPFNAFKVNGLGTAAVLESARYAGVKKTVVFETDKVYGFQEEVPTTEDAVPNPGSPYEISKVIATTFCDFYRKHYNMDVISVRSVNVFGPGDFSYSRILPAAMRNISEGKGIPVYENAIKMYRDFIYVKDVAKMVFLLATTDTEHSIYNFSTNEPMSILQFAERVTAALNHNVDPTIIKKPGEFPEIPYQAIDGTRFVKEFNFRFTPFEEAVRETYEGYCEKSNLPVLGR
ncbi:NAD-dependent epimerase/dehydratase family protein [Neptunomonas sp.]|uniref:NAD-dependent epimerase/dehydratase family protein n=1 Tax=Neptunomonas sp. TaxID=1971898 RepID=UPI003569E39C